MSTKGLGNEVYFNNKKFLYSETNDTRHKRVSSLKTCGLRTNSSLASLGRVENLFKNIVTRLVVLQYRYGFGFTMFF
jgi:hypothetical protein